MKQATPYIAKILFGLSLQLFSLFCLILAYAEKELNTFAFFAFIIAIAAMIAGLFQTYSGYTKIRNIDVK